MGCFTEMTVGLIKYILFFANILFVLCGIAIIVVGVKAQTSFTDYEGLLEGKLSSSAIAIIVIGAIIFIIAFLGCCGAIQEHRCMLMTYGCLILCIFVAQMGLGIWALSSPSSDVSIVTKDDMLKYFKQEYNSKNHTSASFDFIQRDLECCGVNGPSDYWTILVPPIVLVPDSCCPKEKQGSIATCNTFTSYKTGCFKAFTQFMDKTLNIVGIVAIVVACVEVLAIVFAFCLAGRYRG